jgi:hypothetical protein
MVALCELSAAEVTFPATLKLPPSEVPLVTESVLPLIFPVTVRLPLSIVLFACKLSMVALCELSAAEVTLPATLKLPPSEVPLVTESVLPVIFPVTVRSPLRTVLFACKLSMLHCAN